MTTIMGVIMLAMIVIVVGMALTTTVATSAKQAADNMDSVIPGNGGSSLLRLTGTTLWAIIILCIAVVAIMIIFKYV